MSIDSERFLSPTEVAQALGVSRATVTRLVRDGHLAAIKLPGINGSVRIDPRDLGVMLRNGNEAA